MKILRALRRRTGNGMGLRSDEINLISKIMPTSSKIEWRLKGLTTNLYY